MLALLFLSLLARADGKMQWSTSESRGDLSRRLALSLTPSMEDVNDADCIVGGHESDEPNKVYVGGPCGLLDVTLNADGEITSAEPKEGFRYLSMEVVDAGILPTGDDEEVELPMLGAAFVHQQVTDDYAKASTAVHVQIEGTKAQLIVGQTSYLAKTIGQFDYNEFAFGKDDQDQVIAASLCVSKGCDPTDANTPCTFADETQCPNKTPYSQGDYKFSVFLASMDGENAPADQTWDSIVQQHGTDTAGGKELRGDLFVDQVIDFTGMNADTLTVKQLDGTEILYKDMKVFNKSDASTIYTVDNMKVETDDWSAHYGFVKLFNKGDWSEATGSLVITNALTDTVKIFCAKPSNTVKVGHGYNADDKVVYVRYRFSLNGITAAANSGKWMAYDPTITSNSNSQQRKYSHSNGLLPSFFLLVSAIAVLLLKE
jgi:hypothetical protein